MNSIPHSKSELKIFRRRLNVLATLVGLCFLILMSRLIWLQVYQYRRLTAQAESNRIALLPLEPARGMIYDRYGVTLARNVPAYALEVVPSQLTASVDAVIAQLATVVDISGRDRRRFAARLGQARGFAAVPLRTALSETEAARFAANSFRFPGVSMRVRLRRQYPLGALGGNALGYIGHISQQETDAIERAGEHSQYAGSDEIGKSGLEQRYERQLHGASGYQEVEVTASGRPVRSLKSTPAIAGDNLMLTLDAGLQAVVEKAFGTHRGALVAIDPRNGEILAYVSRPGYDPNLFVDGIDQDDWRELNDSIDRPLLNRPLSGTYAPGSTFKPFMALAALELGLRTPSQSFDDAGYLMVGGHKFRDDARHGAVNLRKSLVVSCNTYYFQLGTEMSIDTIHRFMAPFGFGQPTGIDLVGENLGVLPSMEWKRRKFHLPAAGKWFVGDTVSVSNGSGYNAYTPLQMAKAIATLANNGVVMPPHLVRAVSDPGSTAARPITALPSHHIPLQQHNIDVIKDAMEGVTSDPEGTAAKVFAGVDYRVGGKTGTAQVVNIAKDAKYDANTLAERLRDNGLFTAFAPVEQPRIALAVVVENGGWGDAIAAPIARVAIDFYLHEPQQDSPKPRPAVVSGMAVLPSTSVTDLHRKQS